MLQNPIMYLSAREFRVPMGLSAWFSDAAKLEGYLISLCIHVMLAGRSRGLAQSGRRLQNRLEKHARHGRCGKAKKGRLLVDPNSTPADLRSIMLSSRLSHLLLHLL